MSISSQNAVSGIRPVNPAPSLPKRNEAREAKFGAGVPTEAPKTEPTPPAEGHARLDAFSKKIEARFEGALKSENLSVRQKEALEQERDRFQSLVARFESAYLDGAEGPRQDTAEGINKLLQNFSKTVNHILSGPQSGGTTRETPTEAKPTTGRRGKVDIVG